MVDINRRKRLIEYFINQCSMAMHDASSLADMNCELYDALQERTVRFRFKKKDGTIRHANGTMQNGKIPEFGRSGRSLPFNVQMFFDLDHSEFKSFKLENLLDFEM